MPAPPLVFWEDRGSEQLPLPIALRVAPLPARLAPPRREQGVRCTPGSEARDLRLAQCFALSPRRARRKWLQDSEAPAQCAQKAAGSSHSSEA